MLPYVRLMGQDVIVYRQVCYVRCSSSLSLYEFRAVYRVAVSIMIVCHRASCVDYSAFVTFHGLFVLRGAASYVLYLFSGGGSVPLGQAGYRFPIAEASRCFFSSIGQAFLHWGLAHGGIVVEEVVFLFVG